MNVLLPAFKVRHLRATGRIAHSLLAKSSRAPTTGLPVSILEVFRLPPEYDKVPLGALEAGGIPVHYVADGPAEGFGIARPAIRMPAWAVRMRAHVEAIRWAYPCELSDEDAKAEGVERVPQLGPLRACGWRDYQERSPGFLRPLPSLESWWNSRYGPDAWADSPRICILSLRCPVIGKPETGKDR